MLVALPPVRTEVVNLLQDLTEFRFSIDTFAEAIALWGLLGVVVPLIPKHYHSVRADSDGLVIIRAFYRLLHTGRR